MKVKVKWEDLKVGDEFTTGTSEMKFSRRVKTGENTYDRIQEYTRADLGMATLYRERKSGDLVLGRDLMEGDIVSLVNACLKYFVRQIVGGPLILASDYDGGRYFPIRPEAEYVYLSGDEKSCS